MNQLRKCQVATGGRRSDFSTWPKLDDPSANFYISVFIKEGRDGHSVASLIHQLTVPATARRLSTQIPFIVRKSCLHPPSSWWSSWKIPTLFDRPKRAERKVLIFRLPPQPGICFPFFCVKIKHKQSKISLKSGGVGGGGGVKMFDWLRLNETATMRRH